MNKAELRQLIAGGRIEAAIEALLAAAAETDPGLHQEALLLSARYQEYKRAQRNNLESPAELERRLNQITYALLEIVKGLPDGFSMPPVSMHGDSGGIPPSEDKGTGNGGTGTGTSTGGPIFTGTGDGSPVLTGTGDGRLPSKAPFWFSVSAFAVLLAISLFIPGWSQQNNALFKTLLALAAAGVAATLPGFLNFEVGNLVKAGGALAAFTLVFLVNPPKETPETFSVQVRALPPSANYPPLKNVELEIWNKNEWLKGKFSEEGVADFKNLSPDIIGKTVALRWESEYYRPAKDSLLVAPPSVVAEFVPDGSLEPVRGKVTDPRGRELPGVVVEVEGLLDTTDTKGNYELHIPANFQKTHYALYAIVKGFQPYRGEVWPASGALNFSLKK